MTSPGLANIFDLYQRVLSAGVLEYLQKQAGVKTRRGVYGAQVVLWLMILQRLHEVGTLAAAVQLLIQGAAGPLLQNCRRVQRKRISSRTGGYCQARQKLPTILCRQVGREMIEQLRKMLGLEGHDAPRVYLLDGSSVELEHNRELVRSYPPAQNQHGVSHWPVLKMVVLHELKSGLAEEPSWGAMYGPQAVSEQELAAACLDRLPAGSVILGDRNFGVLWVAHEAQQRRLGVVLRLTEARARKLAGGPISREEEHAVVWRATRWDGGKNHRVPADAVVSGRLIAIRVGRGKSKQWLYLFTTLDWPEKQIVELYGERWNIETDLRSLKRTVRLHHVTAKSRRNAREGTTDGGLRIQLGTCRDVSGRLEEPHRPAATELRDGAERGGLRLAQIGRGNHPGTISTRVFTCAKTRCSVHITQPKTPLLSPIALAAPAWIPLQERRKLSGIGRSPCPA